MVEREVRGEVERGEVERGKRDGGVGAFCVKAQK